MNEKVVNLDYLKKLLDDEISKLETKLESEMRLQFKAGNLNIDEDELDQIRFYNQFVIKGKMVYTKKLEILRWHGELCGLKRLRSKIFGDEND